jgi:hypothetical protein
MKGRQYRKRSIKKDSGGGDWMELDTATKEFLAIDFKRTQDARSNYDDDLFIVLTETKFCMPPYTCLGSVFATTDKG